MDNCLSQYQRFNNNYFVCENAMSIKQFSLSAFVLFSSLQLLGCGGSTSNEESESVVTPDTPTVPVPDIVTPPEPDIVIPPEPDIITDLVYEQPQDVARFLTQATFGPNLEDINALTNQSVSQWFKQQLSQQPSFLLPVLSEMSQYSVSDEEFTLLQFEATTLGFWRNAILSKDQLRQRMAFALSEILVVSNGGGEVLTDVPSAVAYYQDLLIEHAFGNYRDLLEAVTYSPAMGYYLTYQGSEKGDSVTGRMPDENYARELLQLFTIGVVELNSDGSTRIDAQGNIIETYDNKDVTGLARVFTGLNLNEVAIEESISKAYAMPMVTFSESHSLKEKSFLDLTIVADTTAKSSISQALDHIFSHKNVGPFIGTQLIQRLVMSNPSPEYIARVAGAFDTGEYQLPNGEIIGQKRRGDLTAILAAILFDSEARTIQGNIGGKIREPILRFSHWARAFNVEAVTPEFQDLLWDTTGASSLSQHPYRSSSVFNFFRPGYISPGTLTGEQDLKAPELQIVNASSIAGYTNFMTYYIFSESQHVDLERVEQFFIDEGINIDTSDVTSSFVSQYSTEQALISESEQLIEHLDLLLTFGTLSETTRSHILSTINELPAQTTEEKLYKIQVTVLLFMTSPDYLVQQ